MEIILSKISRVDIYMVYSRRTTTFYVLEPVLTNIENLNMKER